MITIHSVYKSFRNGTKVVEALKDISLHLGIGEFGVVVGPSGSGKSTLLNLIAGLDYPDKGQIIVGETDISRKSSENLAQFRLNKVGIVFQFFNLLPTLTLKENVAIPGHLQKVSKKLLHHKVEQALQDVGLGEEVGRLPHEASGGEIQRAAIARALINDPTVLLADEPTGNLDEKSGRKVLDLFERLVKERNITLLVVTHDADLVKSANRVFHLHDGALRV